MSEIIIKIIGFLLIAGFSAIFIKGYRSDMSFLIVVSAVCIALVFIIKTFLPYILKINDMFDMDENVSRYISIAIKAIVIAYIAEFASSVFSDFGQQTLGLTALFAGKCLIFIICLPILSGILDMATGLIGL